MEFTLALCRCNVVEPWVGEFMCDPAAVRLSTVNPKISIWSDIQAQVSHTLVHMTKFDSNHSQPFQLRCATSHAIDLVVLKPIRSTCFWITVTHLRSAKNVISVQKI